MRYHQQQNKWYFQRCLFVHFEATLYFIRREFICPYYHNIIAISYYVQVNFLRLRVWTHRERQATKLSLVARVVAWKFGCTHRLRACVRQIGMASYILEYDIIFNRIWHHIYWDMASYHICWNMESYLLECGIIFIGIWHHINWNMLSYLLEYAVIFIVICCHIYWNMLSYLLEYVVISIGIYNHI